MNTKQSAFKNLDGTTPDKAVPAVLRWLLRHRLPDEVRRVSTVFSDLFRRNKSWRPPVRSDEASALDADHPHLTWISHSTFLLRLGGHWLLTDPVFGRAAWTLWRLVPPGIQPDRLPAIDVVTLSHDHYDHLDLRSLAKLKGSPDIVAPREMGRYIKRDKPTRELELWETCELPGLRITLLPAHHWSMRTGFPRNTSMWGGFMYEGDGVTVYFAGDTGFQPPLFEAIRQRFPRIDVAILPIGAYAPRWFMSAQHMDPEEAVKAYELVGAKQFVAMHWGTFYLSSEPIGEPPEKLRRIWTERGHAPNLLSIMDIGETRRL